MAMVVATWLAFAAVAVAAWEVTHLADADAAQGTTPVDVAAAGDTLWKRDCASCHGTSGDGTPYGSDIRSKGGAGVSLVLTTGRMPLPADAVEGGGPDEFRAVEVRRRPVHYTTDEIDALVTHAGTILDGPDVPDVDVDSADLARGFELFQVNCAACHTSSARGGALTNGQVAVSLADSTPVEVVEAMRVGLGTMPVFDETTVESRDADAVAAYVDYLHTPASPLGLTLGYIGPVAEGFVAWLVGIVVLLLVVRWIGLRS